MTEREKEIREALRISENLMSPTREMRDIRYLLDEVDRLRAERDDARGWFAQVALSRAFEDREQDPVPDLVKQHP